jgi:hypothetical protein
MSHTLCNETWPQSTVLQTTLLHQLFSFPISKLSMARALLPDWLTYWTGGFWYINESHGWMNDWLFSSLNDWLTDWLILDWLLAIYLTHCLVSLQPDWMSADCLAHWMTGYWLTDYFIVWLAHWQTHLVNDSLRVYVSFPFTSRQKKGWVPKRRTYLSRLWTVREDNFPSN